MLNWETQSKIFLSLLNWRRTAEVRDEEDENRFLSKCCFHTIMWDKLRKCVWKYVKKSEIWIFFRLCLSLQDIYRENIRHNSLITQVFFCSNQIFSILNAVARQRYVLVDDICFIFIIWPPQCLIWSWPSVIQAKK